MRLVLETGPDFEPSYLALYFRFFHPVSLWFSQTYLILFRTQFNRLRFHTLQIYILFLQTCILIATHSCY